MIIKNDVFTARDHLHDHGLMNVSFVVATYNCVDEIRKLGHLTSLWQGLPVEFCVVDGGSTDGTVEAIRQYPGLRLVVSERDRGIYDAWNKGVYVARGQYISFIGADDEPSIEFFRLTFDRLATTPEKPSFIFGDAVLQRKGRARYWKSPTHPRLFQESDLEFDIPHPGAYNHRRLFESLSFDSAFQLAGDFDFYVRSQLDSPISWMKINAVQARIGATGASRSPGATRRYRLERAKISTDSESKIAATSIKYRFIELIERAPRLFGMAKEIAWRLNGRSR